jgi:hypothetical protein
MVVRIRSSMHTTLRLEISDDVFNSYILDPRDAEVICHHHRTISSLNEIMEIAIAFELFVQKTRISPFSEFFGDPLVSFHIEEDGEFIENDLTYTVDYTVDHHTPISASFWEVPTLNASDDSLSEKMVYEADERWNAFLHNMTKSYTEYDERLPSDECSICIETENMTLPIVRCVNNHSFCKTCILSHWETGNRTCPNCRTTTYK